MGLSIKWNKLVHKYSNCSKYYGYVTHEGWKTTISWSALVVNHSEVDKAPSWVQLQATFRKWTDVNNVIASKDYESLDKSRLVTRLVYLSQFWCRQPGATRLVEVVGRQVD
jgi:hypothetical protein